MSASEAGRNETPWTHQKGVCLLNHWLAATVGPTTPWSAHPGGADLACSVQYSLWLDQHSMADVLKFIKGALNAAAAKMDQDEACKELVSMMTKICSQS